MKNIISLLLIAVISIITSSKIFAAPPKTVYTFVNDAVWTTSGHWSENEIASCGCTPDESKDDVFVKHNGTSASGLTFGAGASLTIQNLADFEISGNSQFNSGSGLTVEDGSVLTVNGNLTLRNGSTIDVREGGKIIVNGNVINENNSDNVTINGVFEINGNFTGENGSKILGGGSLTTTGSATLNGSGTIFGNGTGCGGPCAYGTALPIELMSFNVSLTDEKTVKLEWVTAQETNNDFFTIERSSNGISFTAIDEIAGAGNSNNHISYESYDPSPLRGVSYYRLKQTDFDGKYEYFNIVGISMEEQMDGSCVLKVYPNPCFGRCTITMSECEENIQQPVKVQVLDATGHLMFVDLPSSTNKGSFAYSLNTENNFAPGIYIIKAGSNKKSQTQKVVIN